MIRIRWIANDSHILNNPPKHAADIEILHFNHMNSTTGFQSSLLHCIAILSQLLGSRIHTAVVLRRKQACRLRDRCEAVRRFLGEEEVKCFGRALLLAEFLYLDCDGHSHVCCVDICGYRQNGCGNGIGNHEYNHLRTAAVWIRELKSWLRMAMQCSRLLWKPVVEFM